MERIEISEDGFLFGYGIFETLSVKDKNAENLLLHYERMKNSAFELKISFKLSFTEFKKIIENEIKKLGKSKFILRFSIIKSGNNSKYYINARENNYDEASYEKGFKLRISDITRNKNSKLVFHKTLNYMENYIELIKSRELGYDEAIFFNNEGNLCEGARSNIFLVYEDRIATPKVKNGLLKGIKRDEVIAKLRELGENVTEENISYEKFVAAKEVFITNSVLGIMKVIQINQKTYSCEFIENLMKKL